MDKIHIRTPEEENAIMDAGISYANAETVKRNETEAFQSGLIAGLFTPPIFNPTPMDYIARSAVYGTMGVIGSHAFRKYIDLKTGQWDKDADDMIANTSNEADLENKKILIQKLIQPGMSYDVKKDIIENSPYPFTNEEKDLYLNSNIANGDKLMQFNDFIKNHSDFVGIGGRMLIGAGLAGIYYLWKKWRDRGKIEAEDIRVANKIDINS